VFVPVREVYAAWAGSGPLIVNNPVPLTPSGAGAVVAGESMGLAAIDICYTLAGAPPGLVFGHDAVIEVIFNWLIIKTYIIQQ